ncbi:zinc-ribbon domain-containing protein [Enorma burkinafasonensis]|uniref:zinc-ribbon domain-containing protein n=1 Tax=Enorma burkinafasonensis TaxID=2590867 RepID=UPI0026EBD867|nr:zinc-ribbon domain-containing protein [Enorma burkinafasonensis]MCI7730357.1 zinc-ribbon domain-containing protein [Enorma burkinafasonensis]
MFCSQCGSQIPDSVAFCPACGAATGNAAPVGDAPQPAPMPEVPAQQPGTNPQPAPATPASQPAPGAWSQTTAPAQNAVGQMPYSAPLGMKWFKFIIWFQLFAAALQAAGQAIVSFTGMQYEGHAELVYHIYGGLRVLDIGMGICMVAFAAAAIFIRFELAGFKRDAPLHYLIFFGANLVIAVLYVLLGSLMLGEGLFGMIDAQFIGSMFGYALLIVVNKIYFDKRKALFCN